MFGKAVVALLCVLMLRAQGPRLPELPEVNTANFLPAIREQIERAVKDVKTHPEDAERAGRLGMTLHAYEQYASAEEVYKRAHDLEPRNFDWLCLSGEVEMELGKFDAAAKSFRTALQIRPEDLTTQVRLLRALTSAAAWDDAGDRSRDTLRRHPDNPQAWYVLGQVQARHGDHDAAARSFAKACELFPAYGPAHFALAAELRRLGRQAEAEQEMSAYAKNTAGEPPLSDPLRAKVQELNHSAQAHLQRGAELEKAGQLAEAIREHETALESDPANVQAHVNLIALYGRAGDYAKAKQHFETAVKLSPGSADAWYDYGVLLYTQRSYSEAAQAFLRAVQINPSYAEAHNNLGAVYEAEGRLAEAAGEFREAITSQPNFSLARFHLARILVNQEKYAEAIEQLRRALDPEDERTPTYLYALGAAYARTGDRAQALVYMRRARDSAAARGQKQLLASIDRDLQALGSAQ